MTTSDYGGNQFESMLIENADVILVYIKKKYY